MADFVLTISDDDTNVPDLDGVSLVEIANGTKRKRERKSNGFTSAKKRQKSQDTRNNTTAIKDLRDRQTQKDGQDSNSQSEDDDDGAIDSDFEFQTGDANLGRLEDFDGWGLEEARPQQNQGGDKKAVDIDEIISRRQQRSSPRDEADFSPVEMEGNGTFGFESDEERSFASFSEGDHNGDEENGIIGPDGFGSRFITEDEDSEEASENASAEEEYDDASEHEDDGTTEHVPHPDDLAAAEDDGEEEAEDENDPVEAERRAAFFAPESTDNGHDLPATDASNSFQGMSLSRSILRGLAAVGFSSATPIQSKTIPIALLGKDVVGGAVTGSGKTAAFIIPILERLLYRPKKVPATRVVVLMPTRELAVQCFNVATKLASFTDITFVQLVGGYSPREQEQQLKKRPDVIIATPGRFIDHMINTASFAVDTIEILVLDEADRMLEDGFADELDNILKTLPKSRQTMLFSATMTDSVDKLIRLGLNRPVRLMIDAKRQTVSGLVQEFVRLRPGKEDKRLAYLMHLCTTVYTDRVLIFFRQKKEAHRIRVVFGLCGLKAGELHGSMSQEQVCIC